MTKKLKIMFLGILSLITIFCLYYTIGYFFMGYNSPKIYGNSNAVFLGNYFLAITYFFVALICIGFILILLFKKPKNK
ncbi:MAG: hypothetical protein IJW82_04005 [Clostridia bacterium]|nr:hypothetical protein [Clostridia bacterium]